MPVLHVQEASSRLLWSLLCALYCKFVYRVQQCKSLSLLLPLSSVGMIRDTVIICHVQASAASAQQMPISLPGSTITSLRLRPQQDQYKDMAKFLGYSSASSSLPSPSITRSNHSHAPPQATSQAPIPAKSQTAGQTPRRSQEATSHAGLYPNDHAMDIPSRPHRPTSGNVRDNRQEAVQIEFSSMSSTSTSSQSSRSSHGHSARQQAGGQPDRLVDRQAERQSHSRFERQAEGQPQNQPVRHAGGQPEKQAEGQQYQAAVARVAASPFMADAEHSFLPTAVPPVSAFKSPFMADAEHSFVPNPAIAQQGAPAPWGAFAPATSPFQTSNPQNRTPSTHHSPAGHSSNSNSTGTHASPPTDYFSYLDLLGAQQAANLKPSSQQPQSTQHHQSTQAEMPHSHRQHRQQWQQQGQDRPQHAHAQRAGGQHTDTQHAQVRPSPLAQPAGPSQQTPTGFNSGPLGTIAHPRSAFDSFDTSGGCQLQKSSWLLGHGLPGACLSALHCALLVYMVCLLHCAWQVFHCLLYSAWQVYTIHSTVLGMQ